MKKQLWVFGFSVIAVCLMAPSKSAVATQSPAEQIQNEQVQPSPANVNLKGIILDADKKPIEGAAVWIYTAGPRVGRGYL